MIPDRAQSCQSNYNRRGATQQTRVNAQSKEREKSMTRVAPYGAWTSPITTDLITGQTVPLEQVGVDAGEVYWIETRAREAGRACIVKRSPDGLVTDVTPAPFSARTRAHEYGGACYLVVDGVVFFTSYADHRLYRQDPGQAPVAITPEGAVRYADPIYSRRHRRLIAVQEDHRGGGKEPLHTLVALDADGKRPAIELARGHDFFASPRLSPDETRLAWLTWEHPDMPWDATRLWVAQLDADGTAHDASVVAGGDARVAVFQPEWSPAGVLHYVSDPNGWWNLYAYKDGREVPLCPREAEFGRPLWRFGAATYAFLPDGQLLVTVCEKGTWTLARLEPATARLTKIDLPFTDISGPKVSGGYAYFLAAGPKDPRQLVQLDLTHGQTKAIRRSTDIALDAGYLSPARAIEFPTAGGRTAHAFFYPPVNKDHAGPAGAKPPLLVMSHGGPTAACAAVLALSIQYWTSRGLAVVDVNYGGSTGYGRAYRQRLDGTWGVTDVEDCTAAARYLAEQGEVDGNRLAITGGSAGGYTTLCALTFTDAFKAGASHYGVSDLEALAQDTHKFESRYLDRLIGPYPAAKALYQARSPIHHTDRLNCPVIFLQGLDDKIVPPNQAELMVAALRARKLPVAYVAFEGEQHGFRQAANVKRALEAELYFYGRVFGFTLAEPVEPVVIDNLA